MIRMTTGNSYPDDRSKPEVIDPPQIDELLDVSKNVNESSKITFKPNSAVSTSVRELLECPVCLNSMYPPIHQVYFRYHAFCFHLPSSFTKSLFFGYLLYGSQDSQLCYYLSCFRIS